MFILYSITQVKNDPGVCLILISVFDGTYIKELVCKNILFFSWSQEGMANVVFFEQAHQQGKEKTPPYFH